MDRRYREAQKVDGRIRRMMGGSLSRTCLLAAGRGMVSDRVIKHFLIVISIKWYYY
jgi:hypothetical protein